MVISAGLFRRFLFSSGFRFRLGGQLYWAFVLVDGPGGALSYTSATVCAFGWVNHRVVVHNGDRLGGASFLAFTAGDAAGFAGFAGGGALLLAGAAHIDVACHRDQADQR